jgi:hypothetical protein
MSYKGSSHIGLYLSTLDPNKISEFYDAFWVLISDRRPIKRSRKAGAYRLTPTAGPARRQPSVQEA